MSDFDEYPGDELSLYNPEDPDANVEGYEVLRPKTPERKERSELSFTEPGNDNWQMIGIVGHANVDEEGYPSPHREYDEGIRVLRSLRPRLVPHGSEAPDDSPLGFNRGLMITAGTNEQDAPKLTIPIKRSYSAATTAREDTSWYEGDADYLEKPLHCCNPKLKWITILSVLLVIVSIAAVMTGIVMAASNKRSSAAQGLPGATGKPTRGPTMSPATNDDDETNIHAPVSVTPNPSPEPVQNTPSPTSEPTLSFFDTKSSDPPFRACGMQTPGTLIVDGGGLVRDRNVATIEALIDGIGGSTNGKSIVVLAAARAELKDAEVEEFAEEWIQDVGFDSDRFTVLHPNLINADHTGVEDAAEAHSRDFVKPLRGADAVYVAGGRQWRLVDAFKYTRVNDEMWNLLDRGGVILGTSAGATSQGYFMPRADPAGAYREIASREWHQYGFGYLTGVAFDVHVDARDRWEDMYKVISEHPELLGIGISEFTAIVVKGRYFQVVGERGDDSTVAVYQCRNERECNEHDSPFELLEAGDWYDLCLRERVSRPDRDDLKVSKPRAMDIPYRFTDDYRLGGPYFSCSGRFCRWKSSFIHVHDYTTIRLGGEVKSDGNMEKMSDFVSIYYRFDDADGDLGSWIEAHAETGDIDGSVRFQVMFSLGKGASRLQISIEAQTTEEGDETYIVEDVLAIGA